jgi:hypothetical protein
MSAGEEMKPFRFEQFADAASAQVAFDAAFPTGSAAEPAVQALVDLGAQCKSVGAGKVVCRYVERPGELAGFCWHVALEASTERAIRTTAIAVSKLAI